MFDDSAKCVYEGFIEGAHSVICLLSDFFIIWQGFLYLNVSSQASNKL